MGSKPEQRVFFRTFHSSPDATQAVLAMQVDLQSWIPLWEAAILELDHEPSVEKVAETTGGVADVVQGKKVVALNEDAYLVKLQKTTAAFMAPANRQSVARWLREVDARKSSALTPYLEEARRFVSDFGTPLILALDLEDAVSPEDIKERLANAKELLDKYKLNADQVAQQLSEIRGITLGVTFADKPFGKVKVDFRKDLSLTPEVAKAALLFALANHGAMIDEFEEWKPAVKGNQFTLEGFFTSSGMRRISSLFDRPPSLKAKSDNTQQQTKNSQNTQNTQEIVRDASVVYFHRINELLGDLKHEKKGNSSYTMAQIGVWMDKYAKKIDQLSVLNVDPELVEFGAQAANTLRAGYNGIRTGAARSRIRQVNTAMPYYNYTDYDNWGYTYRDLRCTPTGWLINTRELLSRRKSVSHRLRTRETQMQSLQIAIGDMRRKMTQKYQTDF